MKEKKEKKKKRKLRIDRIIIAIIVLILFTGGIIICGNFIKNDLFAQKYTSMYLANDTYKVILYDENIEEVEQLYRGTSINVNINIKIEKDNNIYYKVKYNDKIYYVNKNNVVSTEKDVLKEKSIYVRTATTITESDTSNKIMGLADKGSKLEVLDYDKINKEGIANCYKVSIDDVVGYVYAKYTSLSEEEAKVNYNAEENDALHGAKRNPYGGGNAINLDFYPNEKPKFENNIMPDSVYSLYLNNGSNVLNNVDAYIEFAKDTKINTFVVDIKDNTAPGYPSKVMESLSPTNYKKAINSWDKYKEAIRKLKDAGFYVVGRITTFKDNYYVDDHPESAMLATSTNKPYLYSGSYWPNPYDRNVWYFTVELAKEAVSEFGFNEIQFDYVRFPDRTQSIETSKTVYFPNKYNEEKAQAIQRFLQYACDELHKLNVYVSADVFGESANATYTTAYGQYWPAISNVVDVISGMPYPDHFANNTYGISSPWNKPYDILHAWGKEVVERQKETTNPAIVRTWIQAYKVMEHVDPNGLSYNAEDLKKEITALFDNGLTGGYITWLSTSSLDKYKSQKDAFKIDYRSGY